MELLIAHEYHREINIHKSLTNSRSVNDYSSWEHMYLIFYELFIGFVYEHL